MVHPTPETQTRLTQKCQASAQRILTRQIYRFRISNRDESMRRRCARQIVIRSGIGNRSDRYGFIL